jgi:Tfp pilus assembly protein PilO
VTKKPAKPQSGKPRTWMITALLAALAVSYVIFIFLPMQRSIRTLRSELQEKRQHVLQGQSLTAPILRSRQQLAETKEVCLQWQAAAPSAGELAQHFARITQQAKAAAVTVGRFEPQPAVEMQMLSQHNVTVHFQGSFAQTFDFLARLEQLPGTVWFRDMRLTGGDEKQPGLQGELTLTIFVDRADYAD